MVQIISSWKGCLLIDWMNSSNGVPVGVSIMVMRRPLSELYHSPRMGTNKFMFSWKALFMHCKRHMICSFWSSWMIVSIHWTGNSEAPYRPSYLQISHMWCYPLDLIGRTMKNLFRLCNQSVGFPLTFSNRLWSEIPIQSISELIGSKGKDRKISLMRRGYWNGYCK